MIYKTEKERNELAKKYLPLVKKITTQIFNYFEDSKEMTLDYEELEGFAWAGLVLAMNKYDPSRSKLSFMSYAGWGIRNSILNGINESGRTIKVSYYKKKQLKDEEKEAPCVLSIEENFYNEDHLAELGFEDDTEFDNPWEMLKNRLLEKFDPEWVETFCSVYGICGYERKKCKNIANELGVSGCLITVRNKKIINYIKSDKQLLSILSDLL